MEPMPTSSLDDLFTRLPGTETVQPSIHRSVSSIY